MIERRGRREEGQTKTEDLKKHRTAGLDMDTQASCEFTALTPQQSSGSLPTV